MRQHSEQVPGQLVKALGALLLAFTLLSTASCVTSVSRQNVQNLRLRFDGAPISSPISGLQLGKHYEVRVDAFVSGGKDWITDTIQGEFQIENPDGALSVVIPEIYRTEIESNGYLTDHNSTSTFQPTQATKVTNRDPIFITTPPFGFRQLNNTGFDLVVTVPGNAYPPQRFHFPIDWSLADAFHADGADGSQGYGGNGGNGTDFDVEAAYYDVSGTALEGTGTYVVVHRKGSSVTSLVRTSGGPYTLSAKGGNGGRGGDGASRTRSAGEGDVYGGPGSPGGNGGHGGRIRLFYPTNSESLRELFHFNVSAGSGGAGGQGGQGERATKDTGLLGLLTALTGVNQGPHGSAGQNGMSGTSDEKAVSLSALFLEITDPDFDRSRLRETL